MPSPIAHIAAGFAVYRTWCYFAPHHCRDRVGPVPRILAATAGLSLLPDVDAIAGVVFGDMGRFHNTITHSLFTGFAAALVVALLVWLKNRTDFQKWFLLTLICYQLHVVMDFSTVGRGVLLFWPLDNTRYAAPASLFYGFHWSQGLLSVKHLWTLANELAFVMIVVVILRFLQRPLRLLSRSSG